VNNTRAALVEGDTRRTRSMTESRVVPLARARVAAFWMTGPSAKGSCALREGGRKEGVSVENVRVYACARACVCVCVCVCVCMCVCVCA